MGDHTGGEDVALEDFSVTGKAVHTLLDAGAAGIVETDDRGANFHGLVHDFADLQGECLGKGAAEDREVLGENVDQAAVHRAVARDHAVGKEFFLFLAEVGASVLYEHVEFLETAFVKEHQDALARRVFALGVLFFDLVLTSAQTSLFPQGQ